MPSLRKKGCPFMSDSRASSSTEMFKIIRDPSYVGGLTQTFTVDSTRLSEEQRYDADRFAPKYDEFFRRLDEAGRAERLGDLFERAFQRGTDARSPTNL
jgi:hypothetical protein